MKQKGLLLAAAAVLAVLLLAACGDRDNKNNGSNGNTAGSGVTDHNGVTDNDGIMDNNGITDHDGRDDSLMDDITGSNGTDNSAGDNARSRADTNSFQRMLDNARVHDTDGDLTDGENSTW